MKKVLVILLFVVVAVIIAITKTTTTDTPLFEDNLSVLSSRETLALVDCYLFYPECSGSQIISYYCDENTTYYTLYSCIVGSRCPKNEMRQCVYKVVYP